MKYLQTNLTDDYTDVYDQTKTTITGNIEYSVDDDIPNFGPPSNKWIDVFTDTGLAPQGLFYASKIKTGDVSRIFVPTAPTTGAMDIFLYNFNNVTGSSSYVGKIRVPVPNTAATTHTLKGFYVDDAGTTNWKILFITTGSVAINGGLFLINNVGLSDFAPVGFPTLTFANGNDQKAVYFLQDSSNIGVGQLNIASAGIAGDITNNIVYIHNGVAATHQYYVYDYSIAPTWSSASVTISEATDTITDTGHTFNNNDPVVFTSISGGTPLVAGTVYFVRNSVAGVSYQLSTTSGGAAVAITVDGNGTIGRAFGTTGACFSYKTGNLPALAGTVLTSNSEVIGTPSHSLNSGSLCIMFGTSSNLYSGKVSELTTGATTWPSLLSSNLLGSAASVLTPTATFVNWNDTMDRYFYISNTAITYSKQLVNNSIDLTLGTIDTTYLEGSVPEIPVLGNSIIGGIGINDDWYFISGTAIGQRGLIAHNIRSNSFFDNSSIISKVINTPDTTYKVLATTEYSFDSTSSSVFFYRTSGFGSVTGGWTEIPVAYPLSVAAGEQCQFKVLFMTPTDTICNGSKLNDILLGILSNFNISDNWEYSHDDSSNLSPSYVTFRLKEIYLSGTVPKLYFRGYDLSNVLVANHNTVDNSSNFTYSSNGGVTWTPLGTIPNIEGTLLRYTFTTPPGVSIRISINES